MTCKGNQERIAIMEKLMLGLVEKADYSLSNIDLAADKIIRERGMLSIDQLADDLCMSPRQLRRKFKAKVGVGPKTYARLKRFTYINSCLSSNPALSWKEFISYGGFYDQSHFIKEFVNLSGVSPTEYLHRRKALQKQLLP